MPAPIAEIVQHINSIGRRYIEKNTSRDMPGKSIWKRIKGYAREALHTNQSVADTFISYKAKPLLCHADIELFLLKEYMWLENLRGELAQEIEACLFKYFNVCPTRVYLLTHIPHEFVQLFADGLKIMYEIEMKIPLESTPHERWRLLKDIYAQIPDNENFLAKKLLNVFENVCGVLISPYQSHGGSGASLHTVPPDIFAMQLSKEIDEKFDVVPRATNIPLRLFWDYSYESKTEEKDVASEFITPKFT